MKLNVFNLIEDKASDFEFYKYNDYFKYDVSILTKL